MATRRRQTQGNNDMQENILLIHNNPKPKRFRCLCLTSCLAICVLILSFVGLILLVWSILASFKIGHEHATSITLQPFDNKILEVDETCDSIEVFGYDSATLYSLDQLPIETKIENSFFPVIGYVSLGYNSIVIYSVQFLIIGSSFSIKLPYQGTSSPFLIDILVILLDSSHQTEIVYSLNCSLAESGCVMPLQLIHKTGEYHFGLYCYSDDVCAQTEDFHPYLQLNKAIYSLRNVEVYNSCQPTCNIDSSLGAVYLLASNENYEASYQFSCVKSYLPYWRWILLVCSTLLCLISATSVVNFCIIIYTRKTDNRAERQSPRVTTNPTIQAPLHIQAPPQYTPVAPLI